MVSEKMSGIVRHHWKEIEKSETLAKLFPEPPVVALQVLSPIATRTSVP
jgi:hypothetical protein